MMSASIESVLQALSLIFVVVVVARLVQLKLFRVYPFFFTLLCATLLLQSAAVFFGASSIAFLNSFLILEPLRNLLFILVVWELFSVIFRNYAGLRSLSRWVMGIAAGVAVVFFVLMRIAAGSGKYSVSPRAMMVLKFERGITLGLVAFIVVMLYFISRYPIKLPRNNVVLCLLYSLWFLGDSAVLMIGSFLPQRYVWTENNALALLEIGSYLGWTILLSKTGEFQETRVRRDITPEDEKVLIGELNAMNDLLLQAGRSISHSR